MSESRGKKGHRQRKSLSCKLVIVSRSWNTVLQGRFGHLTKRSQCGRLILPSGHRGVRPMEEPTLDITSCFSGSGLALVAQAAEGAR